MIKIAVIVPYYTPDENTKALLHRCMMSVDARKFGVIPVEDEKHLGPGATRNEGLDIAFNDYQPDYVTFLDADDELAPDAYDQMTAAIKEAPDAPIIQLNHLLVKPDGSKWPRLPNKRGTYELSNLPKLWASSCNKIFKAKAVKGISFPNLRHGEDELFVLELLAKARRIYNSERVALYYHKDNPNSLSASTTLDDIIAEQVALLEFIDEHRDHPSICDVVRRRQVELWNNPVYKRLIGGAK